MARRAVFIGQNVFAVSSCRIASASMADPSTQISSAALFSGERSDFYGDDTSGYDPGWDQTDYEGKSTDQWDTVDTGSAVDPSTGSDWDSDWNADSDRDSDSEPFI